jgi:hypothetical protein
MAREAGRDPDALEVSVFGVPPDPDVIKHYADGGMTRVVFGLPSAAADVVLPILDRQAELARAVA